MANAARSELESLPAPRRGRALRGARARGRRAAVAPEALQEAEEVGEGEVSADAPRERLDQGLRLLLCRLDAEVVAEQRRHLPRVQRPRPVQIVLSKQFLQRPLPAPLHLRRAAAVSAPTPANPLSAQPPTLQELFEISHSERMEEVIVPHLGREALQLRQLQQAVVVGVEPRDHLLPRPRSLPPSGSRPPGTGRDARAAGRRCAREKAAARG